MQRKLNKIKIDTISGNCVYGFIRAFKFASYHENKTISLFNFRYISEKETADRNYALAYYMREKKVVNCLSLPVDQI